MYCQIVYHLFNHQVHQLNRIGYQYQPILAMNNRLSEYRLKSLIGATLVTQIKPLSLPTAYLHLVNFDMTMLIMGNFHFTKLQ